VPAWHETGRLLRAGILEKLTPLLSECEFITRTNLLAAATIKLSLKEYKGKALHILPSRNRKNRGIPVGQHCLKAR
jgi:hypothetical protein